MQSIIFKVGFAAATVASTANAYSHLHHMNLHARQFFNTTLIPTGTGIVPTGVFPTGIVPTGTGGGGSPPGPTIIPPFANTTSTIPTSSSSQTFTAPPSGTSFTSEPSPTDIVIITSATTQLMTTSTIYSTVVSTITSCPPAVVTKCPESVVTITIPISTTVCPVTGQPKPTTPPVVIVVPIPPSEVKSTIIYTDVHGPAGGNQAVTSVINVPYPNGHGGQGGVPPQGTGTGVYHPTNILTTSVVLTPPQQTSGPILDQSAAGKVGVSGVLALVLASAMALMY